MRRLRLLTAGESHGPAVSGVLEGLPHGLRVSTRKVNRDLRRRQHGYGSGRRMLIERDQVVWMGGLRFGRTLGSPLAFRIENLDWRELAGPDDARCAARPRPAEGGHAGAARPRRPAGRDQVRHGRHARCARTGLSALDRRPRRWPARSVGSCWRRRGRASGATSSRSGPIRAFPDADGLARLRTRLAGLQTTWPNPRPCAAPIPRPRRDDRGGRRCGGGGRLDRRRVRRRRRGCADRSGLRGRVGHAAGRRAGRCVDGDPGGQGGRGRGRLRRRGRGAGSESTTRSGPGHWLVRGGPTAPAASRAA